MPFFVIIICACALCALFIIGTVCYCAHKRKEIERLNGEISQLEPQLEKLKDVNHKIEDAIACYKQVETETQSARNAFTALSDALEKTRNTSQEQLEGRLHEWYNSRYETFKHDLARAQSTLTQASRETYNKMQQEYGNYMLKAANELNAIKTEIKDWEARRDAINQDIMRERQLQEQSDFYRVQLSDDIKSDINALLTIKPQLHYGYLLDKLIYDGYVSKAANEMTKRVLHGDSPIGIYKITRQKTGEVYVGKSTDVRKRWLEHIKTCFNVGSIAHSILHTTMQKDGIDNFTFELLEECPKSMYSEREKFYIDLYKSKQYGLNEKAGSDTNGTDT